MHASSLPTKWGNAIPAMENTCPVACCIVVMLYLKMSILLLPPLRPRDLFNLWIGVRLALRWELIINHQLWFLVEILPKFKEPYVCYLTPLLFLRPGPDLTINSILCTARGPLYIGM